LVADTKTAVPGGTGHFEEFLDVVTNGGDVDFLARSAGRFGIYRDSGDSLSVVVDTNTPIPGGTGNFVRFSNFSTDSNEAAFVAGGANFQEGVYLFRESSLSVIADRNTPIPGGTGNFDTFRSVAIDDGVIAFSGGVSGLSPQSGIYLYSEGSLEVIADRNTRIPPEDSAFFAAFAEVSMDSGDIVFRASQKTQGNGIYLYRDGTVSAIADSNTAVPGRAGYNFSGFFELTGDAGQVTFVGESPGFYRGIYKDDGNSIQRVADEDTPFPGSASNFSTLEYPSADEGSVAFVGAAPAVDGPEGVYQYDGNGIQVVADNRTAIPGGTGTFTGFGSAVSADGGNVLFKGGGSDPSSSQTTSGLYLASASSLSVVADTRTAVPGGAGDFTSFDIGMESLDGGDVVFLGKDEQFRRGVYLHAGGALSVVADRNTPIPGGSGTFINFESASLHQGNVAFVSATPPGIYLYDGSTLRVIADTSTPIQPKCSSGSR
jgi:hypothetical protein